MTPMPAEKLYSYADLLEWDDGKRYELYDGVPVAMASPTDVHQEISMALSAQFYNYLRGKKCKVYAAPFDVRLFEKMGDRPENVRYVLQPDLLVVCDSSKIDRRGVHGAPDLVIEILSESSRRTDMLKKFNLYLQAGVREYWVVDPETQVISVFILANGQYTAKVYGSEDTILVSVLDDCKIDLAAVFPETVG